MKDKIKILHISPNFNYSCGVSKYLTLLFNEFQNYDDTEIHFITNGGDSLERLNQYHIKNSILKFSTSIKNIFYYHNFKRKLTDYIKKNQIRIIHTHHRFPELVVNNINIFPNPITFSTVHSLTNGLKFLSYKSKKIIAVSNAVKKNLIENYKIDENRIILMPNPVEKIVQKIDPTIAKQSLGIDSNKKVILFIGRICRDKGFDILIKSFYNLKRDDVVLIVVGKWIDIDKKIIKNFNNIFYFESQKDVSIFYNAADLIVLPSRVDSFPFTMIEAGLYKKALIAAKVDGIKEFIEDKFNGYLFEKENFNQLTEKINLLLNDDALRSNIANNLFIKSMQMKNPAEYCLELKNTYTRHLNDSI